MTAPHAAPFRPPAARNRGRRLAELAAAAALAAALPAAHVARAADASPPEKVYKDWHVACPAGKPC
ncbi:MAG: transcriptional regulator, partial [Rhodospirillaceae bacterium]|nr:transcriptional regulator [Rhodospirillaceae bacterium]